MDKQQLLNFNVSPDTLNIQSREYGKVQALYEKYKADLVPFCREMQQVRRRITDLGFSADLGDRESELLYLLVRYLEPSVVVEISPCHGYSTNYLLAALTHNNKGKLFSYEVMKEVGGQPITEVIFSNLAASLDKTRLEVMVGDATLAKIPTPDFLFIDSNHEAWFASWYFSELISRPSFVFIHDILVCPKHPQTIVPKAVFHGIREQYYVLQALHLNQQPLFSVADFAKYMDPFLKAEIPARFGIGDGERSIIFRGHQQNASAMEMHHSMRLIHEARLDAIIGNRLSALDCYDKIIKKESSLAFLKLQASTLLPLMGYRYPTNPEMFQEIAINPADLTVSEIVTLFELALSSLNKSCFHRALRLLDDSSINRTLARYLADRYDNIQGVFLKSNIRQVVKSSLRRPHP